MRTSVPSSTHLLMTFSPLLLVLTLGLLPACPQPCPKVTCPRCPPPPRGVLNPPTTKPNCKQACQYFIYCQSPRWNSAKERKRVVDRCTQQCKTAKPGDETKIFFDGLTRCQVNRSCVELVKCLRSVVKKMRGEEKVEDPNAIYKVPVGNSPTRGPAAAPVTMVMFADYECSFCGKAHKTVMSLLKQYPKRLRLVYKHYPLPNNVEGRAASKVAICVRKLKGDAAFWSFHDKAFPSSSLSEKTLLGLAKAAGAAPAAVKKCLKSNQADAELRPNLVLGNTLGLDGTPMFYINGKKLSGALPEAEFKKAIAEADARAKKAIQSGVKPAEVYQHLTGKGHTKLQHIKRKDQAPKPRPR